MPEMKLYSCVYEDSSLLGCCAVNVYRSVWHNIPHILVMIMLKISQSNLHHEVNLLIFLQHYAANTCWFMEDG